MDLSAVIANLDAASLALGLIAGLALSAGVFFFMRNRLKDTFDAALEAQKASFSSLSAEALKESQTSLLNLANDKFADQTERHSSELDSKKELIDQRLDSMKETLGAVPTELEKSQQRVSEVLQQSTQSLKESNEGYLKQVESKTEAQTKAHIAELEEKKKLIDQHLAQMEKTLKTVPSELDKNRKHVSDALDKSTEQLKESNQAYLVQLTEKADTQTKQHQKELEGKKQLIDQRLTEMDSKLGKVERLVQELQTDRKQQYGALGQQLQQLTSTTSSLQKALADNRARGQWGERMAEDLLNFMGLVEGVNYVKQATLDGGSRPDFTFMFANQKSLNMDAKFPLDNYLRYIEADNDAERESFSQRFLRDVNQRVVEIQRRDYIAAGTLDCVLIFIPNEQVYRFIYESDQTIIDNALKQKVIMCSPLTLYVVLAVIRQAAQNFNIEQRSQEIIEVVEDIRNEWSKYTDQMDKLERRFKGMHDDFHSLTGTRTRQLDRKFVRIDGVIKSNDMRQANNSEVASPVARPALSEGITKADELPF